MNELKGRKPRNVVSLRAEDFDVIEETRDLVRKNLKLRNVTKGATIGLALRLLRTTMRNIDTRIDRESLMTARQILMAGGVSELGRGD